MTISLTDQLIVMLYGKLKLSKQNGDLLLTTVETKVSKQKNKPLEDLDIQLDRKV